MFKEFYSCINFKRLRKNLTVPVCNPGAITVNQIKIVITHSFFKNMDKSRFGTNIKKKVITSEMSKHVYDCDLSPEGLTF